MDFGLYSVLSVVIVLQVITGMRHDSVIKSSGLFKISCLMSTGAIFFMMLATIFLYQVEDKGMLYAGVTFISFALVAIAIAVGTLLFSLEANCIGKSVAKQKPVGDSSYSKLYFEKKREVKRLTARIEELEATLDTQESEPGSETQDTES